MPRKPRHYRYRGTEDGPGLFHLVISVNRLSHLKDHHILLLELMLSRKRFISCLISIISISIILLGALYSFYDRIIANASIEMKDTSEGPFKGGNKGSFRHYNTIAPKEEAVFPLFDNRGKTAIVTGAGAGIGLAVAQGLAESGSNVAIWFHGNKKAIDRAQEIEETYGVKCKNLPHQNAYGIEIANVLTILGRAYQVDVTDQKQIQEVVDQIVHEFDGRLDTFVANAGIPWTQGSFLDGDVAHYRKVMATDMDSIYYCAYAAGQHWRRQKEDGTDIFGKNLVNFRGGSFIATASMSGHVVNIPQLQAAYNAAKAAVIHFVKSIAVEMVQFARANTVSPGYMATDLSDFVPPETKNIWRDKIPMGREGEAHELKGAYLYLASDISSYVTGTDIVVDGGYSLP